MVLPKQGTLDEFCFLKFFYFLFLSCKYILVCLSKLFANEFALEYTSSGIRRGPSLKISNTLFFKVPEFCHLVSLRFKWNLSLLQCNLPFKLFSSCSSGSLSIFTWKLDLLSQKLVWFPVDPTRAPKNSFLPKYFLNQSFSKYRNLNS